MRTLALPLVLVFAACSPVASPCPSGQQTCAGQCVELASDSANCGACGTVCAAGSSCVASACIAACAANELRCSGTCVTPLTDPDHCGSCSTVCGLGTHCANGACVPSCASDQTLCSGQCTTTASDDEHCGSCTTACGAGQHCVVSSCAASCTAPQQLCGTACVNLTTDSQHCGACNTPCGPVAHGTAGCSASTCHVAACDLGFVDADGQYANGCELDVRTDLANCGGAGVVCTAGAHVATPACVGGVCGVATCAQGFADCDGVPGNGCEVDLQTTPEHCGACATVCTASPNATASCVAGQCAPACQPGFGNCDGVEANGCETNLDSPSSCGSCTNACSGPNAMFQCVSSACQVATCAQGFSDCDRSPTTGCEVHTAGDPLNCGTCGTICNLNHATASCNQGRCAVAQCTQGFSDCNNQPADGCETSVIGDPSNCGACGVVCALNHAMAGCTQGQCTIASCNPGSADCDGLALNGCETNTLVDHTDCGSCNHGCASNQNCVNGNCF